MTLKTDVMAKMNAGLCMIPHHMHEGVIGHVAMGRPTGSFLCAVMIGDWEDAAARADDQNGPRLNQWRMFVRDHLPEECHGSPEKVKAWRAHMGLAGMADE